MYQQPVSLLLIWILYMQMKTRQWTTFFSYLDCAFKYWKIKQDSNRKKTFANI